VYASQKQILGHTIILTTLWQGLVPTIYASNQISCLAEVRELSLERNHRVAIIMNRNIIQQRHRSWNLIRTQESKDTQLSKTAVVQFGSKTLLLRFGGHVLVESKWIVEVCVDDATKQKMISDVSMREYKIE
jgi:hypothetical protein